MILDSEEQREIILQALLNMPIQGDLGGIIQSIPKYIEVLESVKAATIKE